jgi:hypothetical protein
MNIRNYTSEVAATKSIAMIENKLVAHGATDIMKQYDNGTIKGMCFRKRHNNQHLSFQLPANVQQVYQVMRAEKKGRQTEAQQKNLMKQAERTAWKNVFEWVDIQMTMIAMEQAEFAEVFLPYMLVGKGETVFQRLNSDGFKALTGG